MVVAMSQTVVLNMRLEWGRMQNTSPHARAHFINFAHTHQFYTKRLKFTGFCTIFVCIHYQVISFDSTISYWTRKHGGILHVPINCVPVSAYAHNLIWIFNSKSHAHRWYGFAVASGQCQMDERNSITIYDHDKT